jgi:GTP-binding protein
MDESRAGQDVPVIKTAEFVVSALVAAQYPVEGLPEVAFAGRSNVGKSSLINCLLQRKKLVRTSRTPGQTRMINFFRINGEFFFVDLPGYGYAKAPASLRASWGPMMEAYFKRRETLRGVIQIMDIRHPPTPDDLSLWAWFEERGIPAIPVLTKADKIGRGKWPAHTRQAAAALGITPDRFLVFSAESREGRPALLAEIARRLSA